MAGASTGPGGTAERGTGGIESTAAAVDGTLLLLRHWPAEGRAWATLLMIHGLSEHSGRYSPFAAMASEGGLDVHAYDLRGHGRSGGQRMYVDRWSVYLDDLQARLAAVRLPGRPLVLFGHSMGSLIALAYMLDGRPAPDLLVLSAPPLGAAVPAWQRVGAPLLSLLAPRLAVANPIDGAQLSRDPDVGEAYFADPLVQPWSTARLGNELFGAMTRARKRLRRLDDRGIPTLVIHGGDDRLVPPRLSEPLAGLACVDRHVLPGLRHETLNEPEGPEVADRIVEWIRTRSGGRGAGNG
jgi:acylglycerol lipase